MQFYKIEFNRHCHQVMGKPDATEYFSSICNIAEHVYQENPK